MLELSLAEIFVKAYSYYGFQQNKHLQQSLQFNRIYKNKVISHVSNPWTMWILTCSSGRKKYKALTFQCFRFQLQTNMFRFSIQIMLLYTLNLKGKHRIGMKWIQVILRGRYLVKTSGNVHKYENQWQFITILLGLWQLKEINLTLFHVFLNCLMTYAFLKSHGTQQNTSEAVMPY